MLTSVYYGFDNNIFYLSPTSTTHATEEWDATDAIPIWADDNRITNVTKVVVEGTIELYYFDNFFSGFSSLTTFEGASNIDLSGAYGVNYMFNWCESLTSIPIDFSVATNATYWYGTFAHCSSLTTAPILPSSVPMHGNNYPAMEGCFESCTSLVTPPPSLPSGVRYLNRMFFYCTALESAPAIPSSVTDMSQCFKSCTSLVTAPTIPFGVTDISNCFYWCTSLTTVPTIPSGVTDMPNCFYGCTSLTTVPTIPTTVGNMRMCFYGCSNLAGNMVFEATPFYVTSMFDGTSNDIYIIDHTSSGGRLRDITSGWSNVHYEADDNTYPSVSLSVTRVDSALSEVQTPTGEYAYINAQIQLYEDYLPVGWSNSLPNPNNSGSTTVITKDGTTQTVTWTDTNVGLLYTLKCWINLGDIVKHTFTLQTADKIVDDNSTQKASHLSSIVTQILSKAYKLVDYYHEYDQSDPNYDTEGMAIGRYATQANLFDVDMPSRFRDSVIIDRLVGEIKAYAGATVPTGWLECDGSEVLIADYPMLNNALGGNSASGIGATLWGTASDSTKFVLPNLMGRTLVGHLPASKNNNTTDADFGTLGFLSALTNRVVTLLSTQIPAHGHGMAHTHKHSHTMAHTHGMSHTHSHSHVASGYISKNASSGSSRATPVGRTNADRSGTYSTDTDATASSKSSTDAASNSTTSENSQASSKATTDNNTGGGGAHNNLQPYAVVKYIICAV